jgi:uncharacterized protein YkuJ
MNVYLMVKRDENGKTFEMRVPQDQLADHIKDTLNLTSIEILAVIRLPNVEKTV